MADAFQVWLGGSTHLSLTQPPVMRAQRHDETVLSLSSLYFVHTDAGFVMLMVIHTRPACQWANVVSLEARLSFRLLIEIGLRELSQRDDVGRLQGQELMSRFPAREGPK